MPPTLAESGHGVNWLTELHGAISGHRVTDGRATPFGVADLRDFMGAQALLKYNVDELLKRRRRTRAELSRYCKQSRSWLDKALSEERRSLPVKHLDKIADFFGVGIHTLFQHGLSDISDRRSGSDRRTGKDRRLSRVAYSDKPAERDWMTIIRALSDQGQARALFAAQELLNDEIDALRRQRNRAATPAAPHHTAEKVLPAAAPATTRRHRDGK